MSLRHVRHRGGAMRMHTAVRWAVGILMVAHGTIHLLGFLWALDLGDIEEIGAPTVLLRELEPGDPGSLALGLLWLIAVAAFQVAGVATALRAPWSAQLAGLAAGVSLILTVMWWNDAWIGALLSGAILVAVAVTRHTASMEFAPRRKSAQ